MKRKREMETNVKLINECLLIGAHRIAHSYFFGMNKRFLDQLLRKMLVQDFDKESLEKEIRTYKEKFIDEIDNLFFKW